MSNNLISSNQLSPYLVGKTLATFAITEQDQVFVLEEIFNKSPNVNDTVLAFIKNLDGVYPELVAAALKPERTFARAALVARHADLTSSDLVKILDSSAVDIMEAAVVYNVLDSVPSHRIDSYATKSLITAEGLLMSQHVTLTQLKAAILKVFAVPGVGKVHGSPTRRVIFQNLKYLLKAANVAKVVTEGPPSFMGGFLADHQEHSPEIMEKLINQAFNQMKVCAGSNCAHIISPNDNFDSEKHLSFVASLLVSLFLNAKKLRYNSKPLSENVEEDAVVSILQKPDIVLKKWVVSPQFELDRKILLNVVSTQSGFHDSSFAWKENSTYLTNRNRWLASASDEAIYGEYSKGLLVGLDINLILEMPDGVDIFRNLIKNAYNANINPQDAALMYMEIVAHVNSFEDTVHIDDWLLVERMLFKDQLQLLPLHKLLVVAGPETLRFWRKHNPQTTIEELLEFPYQRLPLSVMAAVPPPADTNTDWMFSAGKPSWLRDLEKISWI